MEVTSIPPQASASFADIKNPEIVKLKAASIPPQDSASFADIKNPEIVKLKVASIPPQASASFADIKNPEVKMEIDTAPNPDPSSTVYDLCIVGAGMFGSAAARHASANVGIKVCLVGPEEPTPEEMINREIFGAHYDEGRIVSNLNDSIPTQILAKNSIKRFRELEKLSGIDFYFPVGFLWITKRKSKITLNPLDFPIVDLSYNDIFQRRYPYIKLRKDDHPLLDDFGAGYINPRNMIAAQKIVAKNQGCDIINDVVHGIKPLYNEIHEILTESGRIIEAKRVLICAGAFINFKNFPMPKLQFDIHKESVALLKISFKEARRLSAMPSIVYYRPEVKFGAYILPPILYPDGCHYLKIGHVDIDQKGDCVRSFEEIKSWYLSKGDPKKINNLSKFLIDMLPGLKYEGITGMTCATSHSKSGQPYIDSVSTTVTVAAVGNGVGAMCSDEIGKIAAILSLTGEWKSELPQNPFLNKYVAIDDCIPGRIELKLFSPKSCIVCLKEQKILFSFPKDPTRLRIWLERVKLDNLLYEYDVEYIHNNARICSNHFEDRYFTSPKKQKLHNYVPAYKYPIDLREEKNSSLSNQNTVFLNEKSPTNSNQLIYESIIEIQCTPKTEEL